MIESLHWLRPAWLLVLPPGLGLLWAWWRVRTGSGPWRGMVDPELLAHLAGRAPVTDARFALGLAATLFVIGCVALAGPSWRAQSAPLVRDLSARVVVLDLSPSMDAVDVVPSRLVRARAAIGTILRESSDAQLGLVVFGADAFTVAPLLTDVSALVHLLASLETTTVPRAGARPDLGLDMARTLLVGAGVAAGDVILVGDSAGDARTVAAARALARVGFPLSVLAVGTSHGGPVRLASGALARTGSGEVVLAKPDLDGLEQLAHAGGGRFHLLAAEDGAPRFARGDRVWAESPAAPQRATTLRQDGGAWFVLLALPLAALLFRRGWLMGIAALLIATPPRPALAFDWPDLWRRADQQAAIEFSKGQLGDQASLIARLPAASGWRAILLYRSGRFAEAAMQFAATDTAEAHYNRGNALALDDRLEAAIVAYDAALGHRPTMRDALFNRAMVREALAQRRARGQGSGEARKRAGSEAPPPPTAARGAGTSARGQRAQSGRGDTRAKPGAASGQRAAQSVSGQSQGPSEDPARGSEQAPDDAELRRLEGLLASVPDDPGSLLANRFAWQLRLRESRHHDTGARW